MKTPLTNLLSDSEKYDLAQETSHSDKEIKFIEAYFGIASLTRGDLKKSATKAGYKTIKGPSRILAERAASTQFSESLKAVGVDKNTIAVRLKKMLADPKTNNKDIIASCKMLLVAMGETVDGNRTQVTVTSGAKSLVVVGFGEEMNDMLKGKQKPLPALLGPGGKDEQGSN